MSKPPANKKGNLRVGVSIYVRKGEQSFWENGIFQNCVFLVQLLRHIPHVGDCYLVISNDVTADEASRTFLRDCPYPLMDMKAASQNLDLMIEMSAALERDWILSFRQRGGKALSMRVGNDYVIDIERMMFNKPAAHLVRDVPFDAVWTLAEYELIGKPYYESVFRAPVHIVPHLWSPFFLERAVHELPEGMLFGYQPGRKRWRAGMFEPNVSMVKTSLIPLLACEVAHRANPHLLERVWAYCSVQLKNHDSFRSFASSLDITKHGLASYEGRFPFCRIVAENVDAVVSHQWQNAQNYVYYEALFGGYPLIHNSHLVGDCGYRYHDFDCEEAGQALLRAFTLHDLTLEDYQRKAKAFLQTLHPDHEANIKAYASLIQGLFPHA